MIVGSQCVDLEGFHLSLSHPRRPAAVWYSMDPKPDDCTLRYLDPDPVREGLPEWAPAPGVDRTRVQRARRLSESRDLYREWGCGTIGGKGHSMELEGRSNV